MSPSRIVNIANLQQFTAVNVLSDPGYNPSVRTIPNCVEVVTVWTLESGKVGHNVLHARYAGGFTPSSAIANSILQGLSTGGAWTALAAFLSTTTTLAGVTLRDLNSINQPVWQSTVGGAVGTSASPALPNEVALVATLRTAFVGPGNRGRLYCPGWATNSLGTGNVAAAAAVTAYQNWVNTIPTTFTASGLTFALGLHARVAYVGSTGKQHPARDPLTQPITSQPVRDNHWDTIRRRGLK